MRFTMRSSYPYIASLIPPVHLYLRNVGQVTGFDVIVAMTVSLGLTFVLVTALKRVVGDDEKASLMALTVIVLFYGYGYAYDLADGPIYMRHRYLLLLWTVLLAVAVFAIMRSKSLYRAMHAYANALAIVLVVLMAGRAGLMATVSQKAHAVPDAFGGASRGPRGGNQSRSPDIIYIIVDGYLKPTETSKYFGYDNSGFNESLRRQGFFVADRSVSNYPMTSLSLATSLNMAYPEIQQDGDKDVVTRTVYEKIHYNEVMKVLKERGYRIVNLASGWGVTNSMPLADDNVKLGSMNEYAAVLLESTVLQPFIAKYVFRRDVRKRVEGAIRAIGTLPFGDNPIFLFAHVVSPHPPYVFGEEGEEVAGDHLPRDANVWSAKSSYLRQYIYITKRIGWLIDQLVARAGDRAVIVLQSDHGSFSTFPAVSGDDWLHPREDQLRECFSNLVAVRYPDKDYHDLNGNMTPVNIFRHILNKYHDGRYPALSDESYYTSDRIFPRMLNVAPTVIAGDDGAKGRDAVVAR